MIRSLRLAIAGLILGGLAGCVTPTGAQIGAIVAGASAIGTVAGQQELIAKAQARVAQTCAFLPTASTIASIAATFAPGTAVTITLVEQVAAGICAAVQNPSTAYASAKARTERRGTYRNVPIRGTRTDGR